MAGGPGGVKAGWRGERRELRAASNVNHAYPVSSVPDKRVQVGRVKSGVGQQPPATAGTMLISSPEDVAVFRPSRKRTSSPLR